MKQEKTKKRFFLSDWAIAHRTGVYVLTFLILVFGTYSYIHLPKEQFPEIVIPTIVITTVYPGNSPSDIENLITRPIEKQLKSISGIKKITSTSYQDYSVIRAEFRSDIPVEEAKQEVKDAVDKAKSDLPSDLDNDPTISDINFAEIPIMYINIGGPYDNDRLKAFADQIKDKLEQLPEITRVDLIGGLEREIHIEVNPIMLEKAQLTFDDIERAIRSENVLLSAGNLQLGRVDRTLRIDGQFKNIDEIGDIVVRSNRGESFYLRDLALIVDAYKERESYARLDGNPVITLMVVKKAGANLISASEKIKNILKYYKEDVFPKNLKIVLTNDQSIRTQNTLKNLLNSIILGFLFVTLVLMFFMGLTNASFVGLAVPLSAFLTFIILYFYGITINLVVLFALLLAMGILVDNAIVVVENIYRLYDNGRVSILSAAKQGAAEVFSPVFAGMLTNLAPFFPLLLWEGLVGEFIKYLPITLITVLSSSLFVAFFINPVFTVDFMRPLSEVPLIKRKTFRFVIGIGFIISILLQLTPFHAIGSILIVLLLLLLAYALFLERPVKVFQKKIVPILKERYAHIVTFLLWGKRPYYVLGGVVALFILSIFLLATFPPKVIFFPKPDPNYIYVYIKLPEGTSLEYTDSLTRVIEQRVFQVLGRNNPDVESVIANVAIGAGDPMEFSTRAESHLGKVTVAFVEYSKRKGPSTRTYLTQIRNALQDIPGVEISVEQERAGPPTGKPVSIELRSEDIDKLVKTAFYVKHYLDSLNIPGIEELKLDFELHKPELRVYVDRERARREGISTAQIGTTLRTLLYGKEIGKFKDQEDDYPIILRYQEPYRNNLETILNTSITFMDMAMRGQIRQIPLASLIRIEIGETYGSIKRKDLKRAITISSNVLEGYNPTEINNKIKKELNYILANNSDIEFQIGGEQKEQQEAQQFLTRSFYISVALIIMILVTLFNSLGRTFIIILQIFFSVIGVFLGFTFSQMDISVVLVGVGLVTLAGIVVNNGILIIEFADARMKWGLTPRLAIIAGAKNRLIPVLLTAVSTVIGLIPMALGVNVNFLSFFDHWDLEFYMGGDTAAFWGPLSWTIIYGLSFATILTLLVLPSIFYIYLRLKYRIKFQFRPRFEKKSLVDEDKIVAQHLAYHNKS